MNASEIMTAVTGNMDRKLEPSCSLTFLRIWLGSRDNEDVSWKSFGAAFDNLSFALEKKRAMGFPESSLDMSLPSGRETAYLHPLGKDDCLKYVLQLHGNGQ